MQKKTQKHKISSFQIIMSKGENLNTVMDNADKVLKLDKNLTVEEVEEFFRDSDDESDVTEDTDDKFEMLPTEAEKEMFKEDMAKFKENVAEQRQKYQPTTGEKLLAMAKSLILRAIVFYFILWLLRRNSSSRTITDGEAVADPDVDMFEEYEDINDEL